MKISYNWLKNYINLNYEPAEVAEILTATGLEVERTEKIESIKGGLKGVLIGQVKTCERHPDADRLSVTTVDIGEKILPVVCGAPNVATGQKVLIATVGTTLYSGDESFLIKKSKIRGVVSEGMICAEDELGLGDSHEGIMVLPDNAEIGTGANEYFNVEEDYVFEIGLTPNRADATSHIGVARDLVAAINFKNPEEKISLNKPNVDKFKIDNNEKPFEVIIEDIQSCPRYSGLTITGVEIKESPDWLKNRLKAVGVRPINNLVDISNFVLHETGQPTHFFDADKIKGEKVIIKKLPEGTKFITLDEEERELTGNDLMICNSENGMCIAGVFGGLESGVTENTKNIFLESAYFDPKTIRKTSRYHGLVTDSSFRFERGADPNITIYALKRAALLIKELAGGQISSEIIDVYPDKIKNRIFKVNYKNVNRLAGQKIESDEIKNIIRWLEIKILNEDDEGMLVKVPTFKVDVTREADIIEEILRIYGFNNIAIPSQLRASLSYYPKPDREQLQNLISDYLSNNGFFEMMNNSLTKSAYYEKNKIFNSEISVKILNPLSSDLNVLRQTLLFSGLESIIYNLNRKNFNLKLYEFGMVYSVDPEMKESENKLSKYNEATHLSLFVTGNKNNESWHENSKAVDFYYLKSFVFNILKRLKINTAGFKVSTISDEIFSTGLTYEFKKRKIFELGELSPDLLKTFDIKQEIFYADINWNLLVEMCEEHKISYEEVPKFPEVRRDLALLIGKEINFEDLKTLAFQTEKHILKNVSLFDIYEGDNIEKGKKSYALSFILQDKKKTLTDKIIEKTMRKLTRAFEVKMKAIIR